MKTNVIVAQLTEALDLVSVIKVSHEAVDVMAAAKQKIRLAIAGLNESTEEVATSGTKEATDNG